MAPWFGNSSNRPFSATPNFSNYSWIVPGIAGIVEQERYEKRGFLR
jgi:hypothetical protein